MSSPCGGCPPCCGRCTFDPKGAKPLEATKTIVSKEEYGCVRPDGGAVVKHQGVLGMMRGAQFHPVTAAGVLFLQQTNNPLAAHC